VTARWWSQEFAPEGSAAAEGIVEQLGRPSLDPLAVLVREAAQNSADARREDQDVVDFSIDVRTLGAAAETWRDVMLPAPEARSGIDIGGALTPESVIMVISDRNTVGLGGAVRANLSDSARRRSDFVQFLRNVGERSDHRLGGGTYGFGKGVFYRLSRCGAILVDTRTQESGEEARRLMGASMGLSWVMGDRRYTGRHWWGRVGDDGIPDPLLGAEARAVGARLGLPGFDDGRTGTDIVVIGADLGTVTVDNEKTRPRTPQEAAIYLASAVLWNLWPKFIPDEHGHSMRFVVGVDGSATEVPSPETLSEFSPFVEALREVRTGRGAVYTRVTPPKAGGSFGLALTSAEQGIQRLLVGAARPFEGPPRHVARMRAVELVVDYVPGPQHPNPKLAYGGVFKASQEADRAFAAAEPPTHDDWVVTGLSGSVRGVVQGAKTFIARQLEDRLGFGSQAGGSGQGLGQLASRLAAVIPVRSAVPGSAQRADGKDVPVGAIDRDNTPGPDASGGANGGRSSSTPSRKNGPPRLLGVPTLEIYDGSPFAVARVLVPPSDRRRKLTAEAFVVLEGGVRETEPPAGAPLPQVVQWRPAAPGADAVSGPTLHLSAGTASEWWVYAVPVPDAVIRFRLTQEAAGGE
jgi:hypothetical protein